MKFINSVLFCLIFLFSSNLCYSNDIKKLTKQFTFLILKISALSLPDELKKKAELDVLKLRKLRDFACSISTGAMRNKDTLTFTDMQGNGQTINIQEVPEYIDSLRKTYPGILIKMTKSPRFQDLGELIQFQRTLQDWSIAMNNLTNMSSSTGTLTGPPTSNSSASPSPSDSPSDPRAAVWFRSSRPNNTDPDKRLYSEIVKGYKHTPPKT